MHSNVCHAEFCFGSFGYSSMNEKNYLFKDKDARSAHAVGFIQNLDCNWNSVLLCLHIPWGTGIAFTK